MAGLRTECFALLMDMVHRLFIQRQPVKLGVFFKKQVLLAGLKVERIISEPTAAAISYGLYQNGGNSRFLVFDLGVHKHLHIS